MTTNPKTEPRTIEDLDEMPVEIFRLLDDPKHLKGFNLGSLDMKERIKTLLRRRIKELDEEIIKGYETQASVGYYIAPREGARAELERLLGKKEEKQ